MQPQSIRSGAPLAAAPVADFALCCRSEYFRTYFRTELNTQDGQLVDVEGACGAMLALLVESMYACEVCRWFWGSRNF